MKNTTVVKNATVSADPADRVRTFRHQLHAWDDEELSAAHLGFARVQAQIDSKDAAAAILANATRNASKAAKRANPRLKRVHMVELEPGARARLAQLAEQRASERGIEYTAALREVVTEQPDLFARRRANTRRHDSAGNRSRQAGGAGAQSSGRPRASRRGARPRRGVPIGPGNRLVQGRQRRKGPRAERLDSRGAHADA